MQAVKADRPAGSTTLTNKFISSAIILVILLTAALYINNVYKAFKPATLPQGTVRISQSVLEQKYGLRVNLVAVTAAGGLVDLRLKIVNGEKAKLLLADAKNFPTILTENGVVLKSPSYTQSQNIEFIDDGNLFIMYPNSSSAVKPGTPITLLFGDIALEPIDAK